MNYDTTRDLHIVQIKSNQPGTTINIVEEPPRPGLNSIPTSHSRPPIIMAGATSVHVIVLGGSGFVARRFLAELLAQHPIGSAGFSVQAKTSDTLLPLARITLVDLRGSLADFPVDVRKDDRVKFVVGDLCEEGFIGQAICPVPGEGEHVVVVHLAALLSGNTEQNFDLGMQVGDTLQEQDSASRDHDGGLLPREARRVYHHGEYVCCYFR